MFYEEVCESVGVCSGNSESYGMCCAVVYAAMLVESAGKFYEDVAYELVASGDVGADAAA